MTESDERRLAEIRAQDAAYIRKHGHAFGPSDFRAAAGRNDLLRLLDAAHAAGRNEALEETDARVETVARAIYAEEFRPDEELSEQNIDFIFAGTVHDGDCIKKPYTCTKCEGDNARRLARAAIRALRSKVER